MPGKRVQFDDETWNALDLLAKDRMQDFQELADEAFTDLLQKHGRPTDLKTALRQSVAGLDKRPPAKIISLRLGDVMTEAVLSRLDRRLQSLHARQRLVIEADHEARALGDGLDLSRDENWSPPTSFGTL